MRHHVICQFSLKTEYNFNVFASLSYLKWFRAYVQGRIIWHLASLYFRNEIICMTSKIENVALEKGASER